MSKTSFPAVSSTREGLTHHRKGDENWTHIQIQTVTIMPSILLRIHSFFLKIIYCLLRGLMWKLDCEESWAPKNWCFWTVVWEKTLESPLDSKEIQPVHPKENQSWVFIGRTYVEAEAPILWPPHAKSWLIGKDPDAGRDWGQEEKGMTEDEMAGWHHQLNGHEFEFKLRKLVMDREAWRAVIHGVTKSWTRLSNWTDWLKGTASPLSFCY